MKYEITKFRAGYLGAREELHQAELEDLLPGAKVVHLNCKSLYQHKLLLEKLQYSTHCMVAQSQPTVQMKDVS